VAAASSLSTLHLATERSDHAGTLSTYAQEAHSLRVPHADSSAMSFSPASAAVRMSSSISGSSSDAALLQSAPHIGTLASTDSEPAARGAVSTASPYSLPRQLRSPELRHSVSTASSEMEMLSYVAGYELSPRVLSFGLSPAVSSAAKPSAAAAAAANTHHDVSMATDPGDSELNSSVLSQTELQHAVHFGRPAQSAADTSRNLSSELQLLMTPDRPPRGPSGAEREEDDLHADKENPFAHSPLLSTPGLRTPASATPSWMPSSTKRAAASPAGQGGHKQSQGSETATAAAEHIVNSFLLTPSSVKPPATASSEEQSKVTQQCS